ncbi:MAG: hypothetical protein WBQ14_02190 [Gaiellaceae bacterium]
MRETDECHYLKRQELKRGRDRPPGAADTAGGTILYEAVVGSTVLWLPRG